jgi:glycolate oxidase iron-sulfur subunit
MLGLHDGDVAYTPAGQEHLDRCLDCRACETACPSGVLYHRLIEDARHKLAEGSQAAGTKPSRSDRFYRWVVRNVLTQPGRLRLTLVPVRILQKLGIWTLLEKIGAFRVLPSFLSRLSRLLPDGGTIWPSRLPPHSRGGGMDVMVSMLNPATGGGAKPTAIIGFFEGCIAAVVNADVHRKAAELLCAAGADVISPPDQVCCGAIYLHNSDLEAAKALARENIDVYVPEGGPRLDYIVTCTAGDGAMLRQYGELLADDPKYAERARDFSERVRDISEVLAKVGVPNMRSRLTGRVTYHDACHLAHAQRVLAQPRELIKSVPGIEVVELAESDVCCGAAGTYNITQPDMAEALASRKLDRVKETGCQYLVAGNIGCNLHLAAEARKRGQPLVVLHPVELVHAAVFAE